MSHPEWKRVRNSIKKLKRKSQKEKSHKGTTMSRADHGSKPTGGHIIPSSSLEVLDRELGRGEFGKVMQGIWTNTQGQKVQVAVKCLSPEKVSIDKHQQDILKEAAIMYSLSHEHLVKLFGVVLDTDSSLMLVTEFAPLRSLAENLKQVALKASFPITLLVDFCIQISDAMRYLHSSSIIHRDLATRNILLFINEVGAKTVKISDFGLSRRLLLGENYRSEMGSKLPLAWMPVEALTKLTFTKASDVYSFGVTMWEMFSYGSQPWGMLSGEEILKAIDKPNFQRLARPEACPQAVYEIMLKCWSHQSDERPTFNEIHSELPHARPLQVRAVSSHVASSPDELTYRTDDIITVIESSDKAGMWTGVSPLGHIGKFECTKTSATGPGQTSPTRDSKKGSKIKRARSSKTKEVKRRIVKGDIGIPSNYQHIFHVGCDGQVEGDPTFGGTDYSNIPVNSISVEKSPQSKRISRPTQLPPPPAPPPGGKAPTKASPEKLEPLETASYSYQLEASPDILHGTSDAPDGGIARKENNHNDLVYQNGKDSPSTPDEFSTLLDLQKSFEMGSLLEECLSAWESVDSQLKMRDSMEAEDLEGEVLKRVYANCTTNNSTPHSINQGQSRSREVMGRGATNDNALSSSGMASLPPPSTLPDNTLNLHNMIIKDRICTQSQTKRFVPARRPGQIAASSRKAHTLGPTCSPPRGFMEEPHTSRALFAPPPTDHTQTAEVRHLNEDVRQEKKWRSEFRRLSSRKQETGTNEYLDNLDSTPPSQVLPVRRSESAASTRPRASDRERAVKSTIKRAPYEELAKAFSPDPGTYHFHFVDQGASSTTRRETMLKAATLPPPKDIQPSQDIQKKTATLSPHEDLHPSYKESVIIPSSLDIHHPQMLSGDRETVTLSPCEDLQSSQNSPAQIGTDLSPQGMIAYDMLIGGDISGSPRRSRRRVGEKKSRPAVPPKPTKTNNATVEMGDVKRTQSCREREPPVKNVEGSVSSQTIQSHGDAEKRSSVSELKYVVEPPKSLEVPPLPPREPVSPMHRVTSRLKSSIEGSPTRAIPTPASKSSDWHGEQSTPPKREQNNNEVDDGVFYRLSAETLERLEQEQPRRRRSVGERRRSRRRSTESYSDGSDHSPVKTSSRSSDGVRSPEGARSPSPSPRRLPNLPENSQTNRPPKHYITPPLPPRSNPTPSSAQADPWTQRTHLDSTDTRLQSGPWKSTVHVDPWTPRVELDLSPPSTQPEPSTSRMKPSLWASCNQPDPTMPRLELDVLSSGSELDLGMSKMTLDPATSLLMSSLQSTPDVSSTVPKMEPGTLENGPEYQEPPYQPSPPEPSSRLKPQSGSGEPNLGAAGNTTTQTLQDVVKSLQALTPRSSPRHKMRDGNKELASPGSKKTSTTSLQDTVKNLRTLSPRSSPRHKASQPKELPNCYAQADDGLDLPPPHVPLVEVTTKGSKPCVPPKPPPRNLRMTRSRTVDTPLTLGQSLGQDRKVRHEVNRANTVATDRDFAKRSQLKSAVYDKCIIDSDDNFIRGTPRLIREILERQGHCFDADDERVDDEPNYPPPPVPLEEPTIMTEKHIPFRPNLLHEPPKPPEPMSLEDRATVLKTLERQHSVPPSLIFEDDFVMGERRHSCASSSSSATYISPRASLIGKFPKVHTLNGVPTPIKHIAMETQEHYNTPRKIPEADLLRYNISQKPENSVSFTPVGEVRQSTGSDVVKEMDYEIWVYDRSKRSTLDPTYEAMREQVALKQRYVNATDSGRSSEVNQGYAVMSHGGSRQCAKDEVRRAKSMDDLLGSNDAGATSSAAKENPSDLVTEAAACTVPRRLPAPPVGHGHTFETPIGYMKMKGSAKERSNSLSIVPSSMAK